MPARPLGRRGLLTGTAALALAGCTSQQLAGLGNAFAVDPGEAARLGLATWERTLQEERVSRNAVLQQRLQTVGRRVVAASGAPPQAWEFVVFEGRDANAFALPGGKVGFYEGIFDFFRNDDQLAAVVGHEIGHVLANHAGQRIGTASAANFTVQALGAALQAGNVGYANQIAGLLGAGAQFGVLLPFSRQQETEADRLGLTLMARAGYDPREALGFWQNRMASRQGAPPEFLSTHPADASRIAAIEAALPEAMAVYQRG